jgi:hypothetical protein
MKEPTRSCDWLFLIHFSQLRQLANPKSQAPSTKQIQINKIQNSKRDRQ